MAETLKLEVATPIGLALQVEVESVSAPSVDGEFTVLANHLPLLASLRHGVLRYQSGNDVKYAAVGPGFVQAEPGHVLLLTEAFVTSANIDKNEALKTYNESNDKLRSDIDPNEPEGRAVAAQGAWAQAQLDVLSAQSN